MERTILRILGKKGRTTIPWPIRAELEWSPGDVLLFEPDPPDRVIITRMEVYEPEEVEEPYGKELSNASPGFARKCQTSP